MAYLHTRRFGSVELMDFFLKGGISGSLKLVPAILGLHGLTLVFTSPSAKTVTFADSTGAGLSPKEILQQIGYDLGNPAVTTEGSTALSAITMASETLTLYLDGSATPTEVVFGTESGEAPILAVLNAVLTPLGVTASAGGSGGLILTTDDGGPTKSIQITADGGGQVALDVTVETVVGAAVVSAKFQNGQLLLVEVAPTSGVALNGASSTAAARLGFGNSTVTGTVYEAPDGVAPRLINFNPGDMESMYCMTEEP